MGHEDNHSPLSTAEVKNECSHTCTPANASMAGTATTLPLSINTGFVWNYTSGFKLKGKIK